MEEEEEEEEEDTVCGGHLGDKPCLTSHEES